MSKFAIIWHAPGGKFILTCLGILAITLGTLVYLLAASCNKEEEYIV